MKLEGPGAVRDNRVTPELIRGAFLTPVQDGGYPEMEPGVSDTGTPDSVRKEALELAAKVVNANRESGRI